MVDVEVGGELPGRVDRVLAAGANADVAKCQRRRQVRIAVGEAACRLASETLAENMQEGFDFVVGVIFSLFAQRGNRNEFGAR